MLDRDCEMLSDGGRGALEGGKEGLRGSDNQGGLEMEPKQSMLVW